jgi:hypothetical protein
LQRKYHGALWKRMMFPNRSLLYTRVPIIHNPLISPKRLCQIVETNYHEVMTPRTQAVKTMKKEEEHGILMRVMMTMTRGTNHRDCSLSESKNSLSWGWEWSFQTNPSLKVPIVLFSQKWKVLEKLSKEYKLSMLCDIDRYPYNPPHESILIGGFFLVFESTESLEKFDIRLETHTIYFK